MILHDVHHYARAGPIDLPFELLSFTPLFILSKDYRRPDEEREPEKIYQLYLFCRLVLTKTDYRFDITLCLYSVKGSLFLFQVC
jgi:hypothetical protein